MARKQVVFSGKMNDYTRNTYKRGSSSLFSKGKSSWSKKISWGKGWWKKLLVILIGLMVLVLAAAYIWYYFTITKKLPDIQNLDSVVFSEATVIQDRNGEELYKMYQENREYVPIADISKDMINAIIAVEDQSFWTNQGIDIRGIMRGVSGVIMGDSSKGGGSTITQQLLKNILLDTSENKYIRKLKERSLAGKLNKLIKKDIKKEYPKLTDEELKQKSKEKIMEMYLNYIFLGQNAYGVEAAARTYFDSSASELDPLQSSIIASLPKSPSLLNPYKNKHLLMGRLVTVQQDESQVIPVEIKESVIKRIKANLKNVDFSKNKSNSFVKIIRGLASFTLTEGGKKYQIAYEPGRKDFSLMNMYDEGYIDQVQLKKSYIDSLDYQFTQGTSQIKAPHFVHWVQEKLLQEYDEETLLKGGMIVKTTLDMKTQLAAEKAIERNRKSYQKYGANNAGLVYLDSKNGDVLAYVGSVDYYDENIDGKVDMVRALRQPGSTMKPFIYALGIEKLGLTLDSPIFDLKLKLGANEPNNADGKFLGLQPLKNALAYSRNIGPIKTFIAVGGEAAVKPFLKAIGLRSLQDSKSYGYPLSIGAGEVQMLELANAYMHLSAAGKPGKIDPILEIRTTKNSIVYQKERKRQKQVIPAGVATLIWKILSNSDYMPPSWVSNFALRGISNYAIKTGTTDKKEIDKNGEEYILPRDGWIAAYTPSKVAIFRGGNTDGKPMNANAYGGWINSPVMKSFFGDLLKSDKLKDEAYPESETKATTIDWLSGRRIGSNTPKTFQRGTLGYIHNLPAAESRGGSSVKIDSLCGGKRSPLTPPEETISGYVVVPKSFMPNGQDIPQIRGWIASQGKYFLSSPDKACEERVATEDESISVKILKPLNGSTITKNFEVRYTIAGDRPLKYVRIYLNDVVVAEESTAKKNVTQIEKIAGYAGLEPGTHRITVEVVDESGFINRATTSVTVGSRDSSAPFLMSDRIQVTSNEDGTSTVYLLFSDEGSVVKGGTVSVGGKSKGFDGNLTSIQVQSGGSTTISYSVKDIHGNVGQGTIDVASYMQ